MARIRTVKPELFRHETLFELEEATKLPIRVAWMGLFTVCDRNGCFRWQPRHLKLDVLPWDNVDFSEVLRALESAGLVHKYEANGEAYGFIPSFTKHQKLDPKEKARFPLPTGYGIEFDDGEETNETLSEHPLEGVETPSSNPPVGRGKGKGKGKGKVINAEPEIPDPPAIDERFSNEATRKFLLDHKIPLNAQQAWLATYGDPVWVSTEILKANSWIATNPTRAPKSKVGRFVTNWLSRSWETYRKTNTGIPRRPEVAAPTGPTGMVSEAESLRTRAAQAEAENVTPVDKAKVREFLRKQNWGVS